MKTNINGPSTPYIYNFTVLNEDSYLPTKTYTELQVSIHDVKATLFGSNREKIEIWFDDLAVITDDANNTLTEGKFSDYLKAFEYVPPEVQGSAEGGGKSMKYALISMFSINMALKMIISSSAALMWSLIHVLQAFRYILMINIKMPSVINILMQYLGVVIGEVDEMEDMIPDVFNIYIINSTDISDKMVVPAKFENYGYETPYLTDLYGRQIFMASTFIFLGMPTIYILMKVFKNVKIVYRKLYETWSGLFWNGPLRTFAELFIEISLGFFLHSLNIRFMTYSGIIATTVMFCAGFYVTFFPFVLLNVISKPPLFVKTKRFNGKYGTLTEDVFKKRTMFQRAYYPLFVFNRILLTGTLVYLYDYPLLQLIIIFVNQIAMIAYLMKLRPFKSELQQVIGVSDEFTIIFGLILLYFLLKHQDQIDTSVKIAYAIIGVLVLTIFKNMTIIMYISIMNAYTKFKRWVHKKSNFHKNKRKTFRDQKKKKFDEQKELNEEKELLDALYRGNLAPSQIWLPGQPSIIDTMIRVERPTDNLSISDSSSTISDVLNTDLQQSQAPLQPIKRKYGKNQKLSTIVEEDHE